MSLTQQARYVQPDQYDDPLGLSVTAQDPALYQKTQRNAVVTMRKGLFAINGITPNADSAVDFFLGGILGLALTLEKAHYDAAMVAMARLEAETPADVWEEALEMVRGYEYAMKDAARSIKADRVQQLEMDLPASAEVEFDF